jgi:hypothetical protein
MSVENVSYEMQNGSYPAPTTSGAALAIANVSDSTYDKLAVYVVCNQAISLAAAGGWSWAVRTRMPCHRHDWCLWYQRRCVHHV